MLRALVICFLYSKVSSMKNLVLILTIFTLVGCKDKYDDWSAAQRTALADAQAYVASSPYAEVLNKCINAQKSDEYCRLSELPLIGMKTDNPSVADIMARVVVSQPWMGERFQALLESYPPEILLLFRAVTAIVIDDDIRPSFYSVGSGAIYLDANNFWLTAAEAADVNPAPDFRSGYGQDLNFRAPWRYVSNNALAYDYQDLSDPQPRDLSDIRLLVASLLLHELAHANDTFMADTYTLLDPKHRPWQAALYDEQSSVSAELYADSPLSSELMFNLAYVLYYGFYANDTQKALSAADVATEFDADAASDPYAYAAVEEDVAMLFEEAMMKYLFDADRDLAFTSAPGADNSCADYIVAWGERNRYAEVQVLPRAQLVLQAMLPSVDFDNFIATSPTPQALANGGSWCDTLDPNATQTKPNSGAFKHPAYPFYR